MRRLSVLVIVVGLLFGRAVSATFADEPAPVPAPAAESSAAKTPPTTEPAPVVPAQADRLGDVRVGGEAPWPTSPADRWPG